MSVWGIGYTHASKHIVRSTKTFKKYASCGFETDFVGKGLRLPFWCRIIVPSDGKWRSREELQSKRTDSGRNEENPIRKYPKKSHRWLWKHNPTTQPKLPTQPPSHPMFASTRESHANTQVMSSSWKWMKFSERRVCVCVCCICARVCMLCVSSADDDVICGEK